MTVMILIRITMGGLIFPAYTEILLEMKQGECILETALTRDLYLTHRMPGPFVSLGILYNAEEYYVCRSRLSVRALISELKPLHRFC
jgi:hypothetical protein